jgi:lipopolysaccharide transport system ATP-binding protein
MTGHWVDASDIHHGQFILKTPWLRPGDYRIDVFICHAGMIDAYEHACHLNILPLLPYAVTDNSEATAHGVVFADFGYTGAAAPAPLNGRVIEDAITV